MQDDRGNGRDDATAPQGEDATETDRGGLRRSLPSDAMPESVSCPFCDGIETEQFSAFGSALSVSQYYCRDCRTVFEWMKWHERG